MTWGTIEVGLLAFRETIAAAESQGTLTITGQESTPPQTAATVHAAHLNVLGLLGATVAVVPSDKAELAGYYVVTAAQSDLLNHGNGSVLIADWQLGLARLGTERDVELESRLPTLARATQLAGITPSLLARPAGGFGDYYTGATVPAQLGHPAVLRRAHDGVHRHPDQRLPAVDVPGGQLHQRRRPGADRRPAARRRGHPRAGGLELGGQQRRRAGHRRHRLALHHVSRRGWPASGSAPRPTRRRSDQAAGGGDPGRHPHRRGGGHRVTGGLRATAATATATGSSWAPRGRSPRHDGTASIAKASAAGSSTSSSATSSAPAGHR
jgi:hypothetical protein